MNKVKVGMSNSPNLKQVRSKIGSLSNSTHRPGGGEVKIENRKLEWRSEGRTQARNDGYTPKGGDKKVGTYKHECKFFWHIFYSAKTVFFFFCLAIQCKLFD